MLCKWTQHAFLFRTHAHFLLCSTLENYFKWQLTNAYVPYLGSNFLSVYYRYTLAVLGEGEVDRFLTCIAVIENVAPMPLARLFTDYVLPPGTRGNVSDLITSIKDAFIDRLTENEWIDNTTRERSIWKVRMARHYGSMFLSLSLLVMYGYLLVLQLCSDFTNTC